MLFFLCQRCKFKSPGSEALCQTCGAHVDKSVAVKEVIYYSGPIRQPSRLQSFHDVFAKAGQYLYSAFQWLGPVPGEETEKRYLTDQDRKQARRVLKAK
jgi:hypothetical protein